MSENHESDSAAAEQQSTPIPTTSSTLLDAVQEVSERLTSGLKLMSFTSPTSPPAAIMQSIQEEPEDEGPPAEELPAADAAEELMGRTAELGISAEMDSRDLAQPNPVPPAASGGTSKWAGLRRGDSLSSRLHKISDRSTRMMTHGDEEEDDGGEALDDAAHHMMDADAQRTTTNRHHRNTSHRSKSSRLSHGMSRRGMLHLRHTSRKTDVGHQDMAHHDLQWTMWHLLCGRASRWRAAYETKVKLIEAFSPLGAYLSPAELGHLARACEIVKFAEGEPLEESPFYLVVKGSVSVQAYTATGEPAELLGRARGAFLTSFAGQDVEMLQRAGRRGPGVGGGSNHAPITTWLQGRRAGRLLQVVHEDRLEEFEAHCSAAGLDGYNSIVSTNLTTVLRTVPFLREANLPLAEMRLLSELCSYVTRQTDEVIFADGDAADAFYIVLKGRVATVLPERPVAGSDAAAPARAPAPAPLRDSIFRASSTKSVSFSGSGNEEAGGSERGVGQAFGVASLVLGATTRHYSTLALEPTLLLYFSYAKFIPFMRRHSELENTLVSSTVRFLLERFSRKDASIFHAFRQTDLDRMAESVSLRSIKKGQTVYSAGDTTETFFVVVDGQFTRDYGAKTSVPPKTLRYGDFFGEVGLLLPRTPLIATVTATEESTLLTVPKEEFLAIIDQNPRPQVELCLRIMPREMISLDLLLLHPKAHVACVQVALSFLKGGLYLPAQNHAVTLHRRMRTLSAAVDGLKPITIFQIVDQVLYAEVLELAAQLRSRPPNFQDQRSLPEAVQAALKQTHDAEAQLCAKVAKDRPYFELENAIYKLIAAYDTQLQMAYSAFRKSRECDELLAEIGAYDSHVQGHVHREDLRALVHKLLSSPAAQQQVHRYTPLRGGCGHARRTRAHMHTHTHARTRTSKE